MNDGRTDVTRRDIVAHLRRRITSGELTPGSRLPTFRCLQEMLRANLKTVARAVEQLKMEGFVDTQGARGTFVVDHPPHLFRYALVFPTHPSDSQEQWPRFWDALAKEASTIERDGPCELPIYYDVNQELHADSSWYTKLVDDAGAHRFAGLIFASNPWVVRGTPLMTEPNMPRVSIMSHDPSAFPDLGTIQMDMEGLIDKSLDYLVSRGRKRLAVVSAFGMSNESVERIRLGAAQRGLELRPYWVQTIHRVNADAARACTHLLLSAAEASNRPDALFVTDDNLVEYVTAGSIDAGMRVPNDLDVVAHCNFPWPTSSVVPVKRIGFDSCQCLRMCVDNINHQRRTRTVPSPMSVPAVFEDEMDSVSLRRRNR